MTEVNLSYNNQPRAFITNSDIEDSFNDRMAEVLKQKEK